MLSTDPLGKASGENFPVAPAVLPRAYREHLHALYAFARLVDDIGDRGPGAAPPGSRSASPDAAQTGLDAVQAHPDEVQADPGTVRADPDAVRDDLDAVRDDLDRVFRGVTARIPALRPLCRTVHRCGLPRAPFEALLAANHQDQTVTDYVDRGQLLQYCRLSANPVGHLVLGVFGVRITAARRADSDAVCTALQLIEHLQDIGEDAARGRIYLPREDRDRYGVRPGDLRAGTASPDLRRLVLAEARWAEELLRRGSGLVRTLHGWPRLAVAGYVAGGAAALRDLRRAGGDTLSQPAGSRPAGRRRTDLVIAGLQILRKGELR